MIIYFSVCYVLENTEMIGMYTGLDHLVWGFHMMGQVDDPPSKFTWDGFSEF